MSVREVGPWQRERPGPPVVVRRSPSAARASELRRPDVAMWIWTRRTNPLADECAQELVAADPFRVSGTARATERDALIDAILDQVGLDDSPRRRALAADISSLTFLHARASSSSRVRIRLEAGQARPGPFAHLEDVSLRLLCTYSGPGAEWRDPADGRTHRMAPGWAALVKGHAHRDGAMRGVAHVPSPGDQAARLVLLIQDEPGTRARAS